MLITAEIAMIGSGQIGLSSPYDCHVYAIRSDDGLIVIDSGCGAGQEQILQELKRDFPNQQVQAILLTHAHADHFGGAAGLQEEFGCQVFAPNISCEVVRRGDSDRSGFRAAQAAGVYPDALRLRPCQKVQVVNDGYALSISNRTILPLHVRGHSSDSFCFLTKVKQKQVLFSGDVLFYGGVLGVINSQDSDMAGYRSDLPKLAGLGVEMLFPSHGLFTLCQGQRHIDVALEQSRRGFLPRQIGQGDLLF